MIPTLSAEYSTVFDLIDWFCHHIISILYFLSTLDHTLVFAHLFLRPRLKNVDRSSAQHLEVTVGDLTVIITDFKEKAKPTSTPTSAASADQHSQSGSSSDNTERGVSRSSSPRCEGLSVNGETH